MKRGGWGRGGGKAKIGAAGAGGQADRVFCQDSSGAVRAPHFAQPISPNEAVNERRPQSHPSTIPLTTLLVHRGAHTTVNYTTACRSEGVGVTSVRVDLVGCARDGIVCAKWPTSPLGAKYLCVPLIFLVEICSGGVSFIGLQNQNQNKI